MDTHWTVVPLPEVGTVEPAPVVPTLEERVADCEDALVEIAGLVAGVL